MAQAARQTIANDVFARVNKVLTNIVTYWAIDSWDFRSLLREAEKLTSADSFQGAQAQALVFQLAGDVEAASKWCRNAEAHQIHAQIAKSTQALILSNLGYFSQARELLAGLSPIEWPLDRVNMFLLCGCWTSIEHRAKGDLESADETWHEALKAARRCSMTLANVKISEQHIAKVADLAGEVLRAHKLFFAGAKPIVRAFDDGILYQLPVKVDAKMSADMTEEVIIKMVEQDLDLEAFSFSFIPD